MAITDNFESYSDGDLNGQGSWSGSTYFDVQSSVTKTGSKAVSVGTIAANTIAKAFPSGVASGTQAFYIRSTGTHATDAVTFRLTEGGTRKIIFGMLNGNFVYHNGAGYQTISAYSINTWYAITIEWRSSDKKARYKINDTWTDWFVGIENFTTSIGGVLLFSSADTSQTTYFDDLSETITPPPSGPANLKTYNTNVKANIKSINTNILANIKSLNTNV